jgi:cyclase
VIVCRIVPGTEGVVGGVFGHYHSITRPQDLGVIGRRIPSHHDLYIHTVERREDSTVSGQRRGLPAFQEISEEVGPSVPVLVRG